MPNPTVSSNTKEYIRPMPSNWWLKRKTYLLFMIRELTCLFVGGYALFLLCLAAKAGDAQSFEGLLLSPWSVVLHVIALPMVLYHSITWINLTPKVMVIWRGEKQVDPKLIAAANHVVWALVSIVIAWIALAKG